MKLFRLTVCGTYCYQHVGDNSWYCFAKSTYRNRIRLDERQSGGWDVEWAYLLKLDLLILKLRTFHVYISSHVKQNGTHLNLS